MQQFTLAQARAYNRSLIQTNQQGTGQIKRWYDQGYRMHSDGLWYIYNMATQKYDRKYYTGG